MLLTHWHTHTHTHTQHKLDNFGQLGMDTGARATRIAARVWGKDDDDAAWSQLLAFKQADVDKIVAVANLHGPHVQHIHMTGIREDHGQVSRLCACIGSPCLRHCVHGASITGGAEPLHLRREQGAAAAGGRPGAAAGGLLVA
jgi:hypothetical protein